MGAPSIRFKPDLLDQALIDFRGVPTSFDPQCTALILNQSHNGCALVLESNDTIMPEKMISIKVGKIDPLKAQIVWAHLIDKDLYKVGIQFLE